MRLWPVIQRELRDQARQSNLHWLRLAGTVPLLSLGSFYWLTPRVGQPEGGGLFAMLHAGLFGLVWMLVPVIVADSISRERREGTLPLLLLTPLRLVDVVVAKGFASTLRSFTVVLTSLPVLVVPFLMGGVPWQQATFSVVLVLSWFMVVVAGSLLASASHVSMAKALAYAYLTAFLSLTILLLGTGMFLGGWITGVWRPATDLGWYGRLGWAAFFDFHAVLEASSVTAKMGASASSFGQFTMQVVVLALCLAVSFLLLAGRQLRRVWAEPGRSAFRRKLAGIFCQPRVARGFYRWWIRRKLERNPVGWLEQRTWQARLVTWSWLGILTTLYSFLTIDLRWFVDELTNWQQTIGLLLLFSLAVTTAGSFQRERESGVLEILLVSPLRVSDLVWGRLRGIWGQFLPMFLLFASVWIYMGSWHHQVFGRGELPSDILLKVGRMAVVFLALPVVGLYGSLRTRTYMAGLVFTLLIWGVEVLVLRYVVVLILGSEWGFLVQQEAIKVVTTLIAFAYWGGAAHLFFHLLKRLLEQRRLVVRTG